MAWWFPSRNQFRKPELPPTQVAADKQEQTTILAGTASTSLLPLRKPSLASPEPAAAGDKAENDDQEMADTETTESTSSTETNPGPSQTVADSDKTAPSETKATQ